MPATVPTAKFVYQHRLLAFSVMGIFSLAIWWRPLLSLFDLALRDDRYTHLLLILPLAFSLILLEGKPQRLPPESRAWAQLIGVLLITIGALARVSIWLQGFRLPHDQQLSIDMAAVVIWWIAAFLISFGNSAFRHAFFPLCFLFWIVPLPEVVLNPIVRLLQQGSVESARLLFSVFGIPVAQYGTQLTIPGLTIEVARECSSIRSSLILLVTTMVMAQVRLRSGWRKAVIIAAVVPISFAKNGLRIFVLAILTTRVDQSFISGRLHHEGGVIYFAIALAVVILLIWSARRSESRSELVSTQPELVQSVPATR